MLVAHASIEKDIDFISKAITLIAKLGIFFGGFIVILYSLRINHFPQDLTVGDGVLFLMAASCFGFVYLLFCVSLLCIGITFSPLVRPALNFVVWAIEKLRKQKAKSPYSFAPFSWGAPILSLFALPIIIYFMKKDPALIGTISLLPITEYLIYSIYYSTNAKIIEIESVENSLLHTPKKESISKLGNIEKFKKDKMYSLLFIFIAPMAVGGFSGLFLDGVMRLAHIRSEKPIIFLKAPYSELIPKPLISPTITAPKDYIAIEGAIILFRGFGKKTVISFQDHGKIRQLEIPNEQIIVENH